LEVVRESITKVTHSGRNDTYGCTRVRVNDWTTAIPKVDGTVQLHPAYSIWRDIANEGHHSFVPRWKPRIEWESTSKNFIAHLNLFD